MVFKSSYSSYSMSSSGLGGGLSGGGLGGLSGGSHGGLSRGGLGGGYSGGLGSLSAGVSSAGRSLSAGGGLTTSSRFGDVFSGSKWDADFDMGSSKLSRSISMDRDINAGVKDPIYIGNREEVILGYAKIRTPEVGFEGRTPHVHLRRGTSPSPARVPRPYYEEDDYSINGVDDYHVPRTRARVPQYKAHSLADLDDYDEMPRVRLASSSHLYRSTGRLDRVGRRGSVEDLEASLDGRRRSRTPLRSSSFSTSHILPHGQVDQGAIEREVRARRSASMCRLDDEDDPEYFPIRARSSTLNFPRRSISRSRSVGPRDLSGGHHDSFIYSTADSWQPSDIHMMVLPSGKKAVTHTRLSYGGRGRDGRIDLDALAFRTRHLQSTMHSLENFVRRNRSLFPEETMIEQSLSLYRLPEAQLRKIGAGPDAEIYGCKVREKLIVPHGTDVMAILMKHYGAKRDFEVEYRDPDHLRRHIKTVHALDESQMRQNFRRQVEEEFERKRPRHRRDDTREEYERKLSYLTNEYIKSVYANSGLDYDSLYSRRSSVDRTSSADRDLPTSGKPSSRKKRKSYDTSPQFTAKLRPKRCAEGQNVRFNCSVSGMPPPEISWYKGNRKVGSGYGGGRFITTVSILWYWKQQITIKYLNFLSFLPFSSQNEYGLCSLEISKVRKEDAGTILVKAINSEGEVSCSALLEVVGKCPLTSPPCPHDNLRIKLQCVLIPKLPPIVEEKVICCCGYLRHAINMVNCSAYGLYSKMFTIMLGFAAPSQILNMEPLPPFTSVSAAVSLQMPPWD